MLLEMVPIPFGEGMEKEFAGCWDSCSKTDLSSLSPFRISLSQEWNLLRGACSPCLLLSFQIGTIWRSLTDGELWSNELSASLDVSKGCEAFCPEELEDYVFLYSLHRENETPSRLKQLEKGGKKSDTIPSAMASYLEEFKGFPSLRHLTIIITQ